MYDHDNKNNNNNDLVLRSNHRPGPNASHGTSPSESVHGRGKQNDL